MTPETTPNHPHPGEVSGVPKHAGIGSIVMSTDGIYGLIIVAGMIVVSRNLTGTSGEALFSVITTLLVFFAAHVFAATMSALAQDEHKAHGLGDAFRHGVRESVGLLVVGALPIAILALGVVGILRNVDAVWLALGADVILLGLLGWFIAARRTDRVWVRLGSVVLTAAFGLILIALKALVK